MAGGPPYATPKSTNTDPKSKFTSPPPKFIFAALKSINANIEDQEAFLAAMSSTKIQAPCSMVSLDKNNNVVRDFLITRIEKVGGRVENVVKKVIPQVAQPPQGFSILEKK